MQSIVQQCPRVRLHGFCLYPTPNFSQGATEPEIATFAEGCFWGVEHIFLKHFPPSQNKGILKTSIGYMDGNPIVTYPTYQTVCSGATDHAEALRIEFDPGVVSYQELVGEYRTYCVLHAQLKLGYLFLLLLEFFYRTHDPTTINQQGADMGTRTHCLIFVSYDSDLVSQSIVQQYISTLKSNKSLRSV